MNKWTAVGTFIFGAALGSVVTWKIVKTKYERIADEEIKSMKEYYKKKYEVGEPDRPNEPDKKREENLEEYESVLTEQGYATQEEIEDKKGGAKSMNDKPYVIAPDEFGDNEEYETVSLTYYADKVLADEDNEVVHDVEDLVGYDSLKHFGEYEDDSVFVRNDRLQTDYEILLDERKYADSRRRPYNPQVDD